MNEVITERATRQPPASAGIAASLDTSEQLRQSTYAKRARSKFLGVPLATQLTEYAKTVDCPVMEKAYRRSIYCASVIVQEDGKMTARYCGCRWCPTCSRIRTARTIDAYGPVIGAWSNPHMVTLTIPNVAADDLPGAIDRMVRAFQLSVLSMRRTHKLTVIAVRKIEVTHNRHRDDYHPHLHVLINGEAQARLLRSMWLDRFPTAELAAQDVRPCDKGSVVELAKYTTKMLSGTKLVPVEALHTIFRAMRGRRVWQSLGFTLPPAVVESIEGEEIEVIASEAFKRPEETIYWQWNQEQTDWVDIETGELLSEYTPSDRFRELVGSIEESLNINRTLTDSSLNSS